MDEQMVLLACFGLYPMSVEASLASDRTFQCCSFYISGLISGPDVAMVEV